MNVNLYLALVRDVQIHLGPQGQQEEKGQRVNSQRAHCGRTLTSCGSGWWLTSQARLDVNVSLFRGQH